MKIAINTRSTTTGNAVTLTGLAPVYASASRNAVVVTDLTQEIDGIPISFFEAMGEVDRGELEDFGEGLDG